MPDADPAGLVRALVGGARRARQRMVLHSGWGRLRESAGEDPFGEDLLVGEDVPHGWLLPRMSVVVHHGGAGTTAAALRAGVPAVVVPQFADQFFWAPRVAWLGAGDWPLARERLGVDTLAAALAGSSMSYRWIAADRVAEALAHEDGVDAAVDVLEDHVDRHPRGGPGA